MGATVTAHLEGETLRSAPPAPAGLLRPLAAVAEGDLALVGGKALRLGRALALGFPVPDGFVVTTDAFHAWMSGPGDATGRPLSELIADALRGLRDVRRATSAAQAVQAVLLAAPLPVALVTEARRALAPLEGVPLAVRSSAVGEDGATRSLAGHFDSFLDVRGADAVLDAIRRAWASSASERVLTLRLREGGGAPAEAAPGGGGAPAGPVSMAVLVQRMVRGGGGGVLFTQDPVSGAARMVAELSPEGAEGVAGGETTPLRVVLERESGRIIEGATGAPGEAALAQALARLGARLEAAFQGPQDVEWARDGEGRLALLQTRPIVAPASGAATLDRWTAANSQEAIEDPVTPLTYTFLEPWIERGRRAAFQVLGAADPRGAYMRRFDGRIYFNADYFRRFLESIPGAPPEIFDLLIFGEAGEIKVPRPPLSLAPRLISVLRTAWHHWSYAIPRMDRFIERLVRRTRRLAARDLGALTDAALLGHLEVVSRLSERALNYHVLGTAMAGGHYLVLQKFLKRCGLRLDDNAADELLAGAPGIETAKSNAAIFELARLAERLPSVRSLLLREEPAAVLGSLAREGAEAIPGAPEFLAALERFLDAYGHRAESEAELAAPRWREDPGFVLRAARRFLELEAGGARRSPSEAQEQLAAHGRRLARRIDRGLAGSGLLGGALRAAFRFLLRWAERSAPYRENLRFHALRGLAEARRAWREIGRRLAARGALADRDAVFFLEAEEALAALRRGADLGDEAKAGLLAAARRRAAEHADSMTRRDVPRLLFDDGRAAPVPVRAAGASGRAGLSTPPPLPEGATAARTLVGVPVSQGLVTGRVRRVERIEDGWSLAPDEILLARAATPSWTPLFFFAKGVILDIGGMLSHCAVIAREYGIPCVVGLRTAMADIEDGSVVTVDAYSGRVYVHARSGSPSAPAAPLAPSAPPSADPKR